jgi:UDPglucose 6-dehydrogenase
MAGKIIAAAGGSVAGKRIAVLGVTFKPNTDDMREAPSLVIVPALRDAGAEIVLCDPKGRNEGEGLLGKASWVSGPYAAAENADILVLITEWNEFRALDFGRIRAVMKGDLMVDLRNVYLPTEVRAAGLTYVSIGRS